ncbi:membrane protein [Mycoplasma ovis str. Michigan]|uniref:Membrane protein n=1 Tax=Mycoplasma ovis str. Michigan TaxID=1415773 RepID=A0ABN4BQQ0_9MOLU|nr:lysylphosphatidylglycerol synthase domain-containing protein [Mycoplasma ovis]AHC39999.1 membrane protein [Mycoplasma ovis str. Michigan]
MFIQNLLGTQLLPTSYREGNYRFNQPQTNYLKEEGGNGNRPSRAISRLYQFNKKYFLNVWVVLFLIAVFLNLYFFQPIEWTKFNTAFDTKDNTFFTSVIAFGVVFFLINDLVLYKWAFSLHISKASWLKRKIPKIEWLKLLSITFFIRSVTPFSIGSEPYVIFWLKKRGIPLRRASAIVSSLTVSWLIAQAIITWPSFITLQVKHNLVAPNDNSKYSWIVIAGLIVDIVSTIFVFTISYCKWVHYSFGLIRLRFNRIFKIKSSTALSKSELKHKHLDNKSFTKEFKRAFFNNTTIKVLFLFTVQNILNYSLYALLAISTKGGELSLQNFLNSFHIINISTTSNNFVPTPGSEGSIQFTIKKMNELVNPQPQPPPEPSGKPLEEVIFLWRWFQKYKPFLLSSSFLVIYFLVNKLLLLKRKIKEQHPYKQISQELVSWYNVSDSLVPS